MCNKQAERTDVIVGRMLYPRVGPGPFRASQLRDGDRYELSDGHAIYCPPASLRRGQASLTGAGVIDSDPAVPGVAANVGIAFNNDRNLRAPDIIVTADAPPQPGWLDVAPPLAVEYVEPGHDEVMLHNLLQRRGYASFAEFQAEHAAAQIRR